MLVFPQFTTGVVAMYPLKRTIRSRTVVNIAAGGERVVSADAESTRRMWELRVRGMTEEERATVEALFQSTKGRLNAFTLLDPVSNLVARSEELENSAWVRDPLLQVTHGLADPWGTFRAASLANPTVNSAAIMQTIDAPGTFHYTFSLWMRTDDSTLPSLKASAGVTSSSVAKKVGTVWRRLSRIVSLSESSETISFGVELPPGGAVEVAGIQVEAQPGPSVYKKTVESGGVISNAHFAEDRLTVTADSSDVFNAVIGLIA